MTITATYIHCSSFDNLYSNWRPFNIYVFKDTEGHKYVWKSSTCPMLAEGALFRVGNTYKFDATVKEETIYKGEPETILTRCKNFELVEETQVITKKHRITRDEQLATLNEGDQVIRMAYSRYKEHYADCETVVDSYQELYGYDGITRRVIEVIVKKGRMKKSGTRGEEYSYYRFQTSSGELVDLKAISLDNAMRRAKDDWAYVGELTRNLQGGYNFERAE